MKHTPQLLSRHNSTMKHTPMAKEDVVNTQCVTMDSWPAKGADQQHITMPEKITFDQIDPTMVKIIEKIFPKLSGIEFLSCVLRHAEIIQNVLPGMQHLGEYVAVINVRTVRILAEKIGWGYDTTHKYEVIFCALRFFFKQRTKKQLQLIFPMQHYTPPTDLQDLDYLITNCRPKVRQFAQRVKERLLLHNIMPQTQTLAQNNYPIEIAKTSTEQTLLKQLFNILQSEGINHNTSKQIALRISSEVLSQLLLPASKNNSPKSLPRNKAIVDQIITQPSGQPNTMLAVTGNQEQASAKNSALSAPELVYQHESTKIPSNHYESTRTAWNENEKTPRVSFSTGYTIGEIQARIEKKDDSPSEIIARASKSSTISKVGLQFLKRALSRNAEYKQHDTQEDVGRPGDHNQQVYLPIKNEPTSSVNDTQEDFFSTKVDSYIPEEDFFSQQGDASITYSTSQEDFFPTKVDSPIISQANEVDFFSQKEDFLTPAISPLEEILRQNEDEALKKYTSRVPRTVDFLKDFPELRNVTLNINNIIFNIYNNKDVTLRNKHLGTFFAKVFEGTKGKWFWYNKMIDECGPEAMVKAFLEIFISLHEKGSETISKPGAIFIEYCRSYERKQRDSIIDFKKYDTMDYEQFIRLLEKHALFEPDKRLQ